MVTRQRDGRGSNQYQTRPATVPADRTRTADDVAWAFHPDQTRWADVGVTTFQEAEAWLRSGGTRADAAEWYAITTPDPPSLIAATTDAPPLVYVAAVQPFAVKGDDPPAVMTVSTTVTGARESLCRYATRRMRKKSTGYGPLDVVRCYATYGFSPAGSCGAAEVSVHGLNTGGLPKEVTVVTLYDYGLITHVASTDDAAQEWLEQYVTERWKDWGDVAHGPAVESFFHAVNGRYTLARCTITD